MTTGSRKLVELGEVLVEDRDRVRVEAGTPYRVAGVLIAGDGLFHREVIDGADTKYEYLHRLRTDQLVYRKLTAWEGPITVVPEAFDGSMVSPEFPTFSLDQSRLLPTFMRLICQHPGFHYEMKLRSTGTAERRSRLNPHDLLEIEVELPPIEEQAAIVEALRTIEQLEDALSAEHRALEQMLRSLHATVEQDAEDEEELGSVVTRIEAGKSPKCLDRRPTNAEWGVLKVSAIRSGRFVPEEAKALPPQLPPFERALVREGDFLVSRANTPDLVGAACLASGGTERLLLCDKTLRLILDDHRVDAQYLVEAMALPGVREQIILAATGSSASMKNISQDSLRQLTLPLPSLSQQTAFAHDCLAIRDGLASVGNERRSIRTFRASLLDELITGTRRVAS